MTQQEILNSNWTKTKKAEALFDLGFTRLQVADLICNGNRGFSYNIWKKWNERRTEQVRTPEVINFDFEFNRKFGVEIEFFGTTNSTLTNNFGANDGWALKLTPDYSPVDLYSDISEIQIYPNPTQDNLTVKIDPAFLNQPFQIFSITGQLVLSGKLTSENSEIHLNSISEGVYLLQIGNQSKKIVKIK